MMTDALPEPLVPAEVDLRGLPWMRLEIERLKKSKAWIICKRRPELAFYLINLWTRAWHEVPAASLEDDDDILADAAMIDPRRWPKLKADALRGWVLCSDGRWYNPTVAEIAIEAWEQRTGSRQTQRQRTEAARLALSQKRARQKAQSATDAPTVSVTDEKSSVTVPRVEGEREREEESPDAIASDPQAAEATDERRPKRQARKQGIPADWKPDERDIAFAFEEHGWSVERCFAEGKQFRDHHRGKGNTFVDPHLAWCTWVRNGAKFDARDGNGRGSRKLTPAESLYAGAALALAERERARDPGAGDDAPQPLLDRG